MLSIEDCRRILDEPGLTDEQIRDIRDTLYAFADVLVADALQERQARRPPPL